MMAIAALALTFAACGEKNANGESAGEEGYTIYTNDKYGFTVDVPEGLEQIKGLMPEEGTVYSADKGQTAKLNRIDIAGGKQIFDEEYTPEKVKAEFKSWTENIEADTTECGDSYFAYTIKSEQFTEMHRHVFKGSKKAMLSVCFDDAHEKQLGGDVAKHVLESVKFK